MASAPELDESGGITARVFIDTLCPVGSVALVDEDDGQTQGSYGRILAEVHCNGVSLNEELLDSGVGYLIDDFCDDSTCRILLLLGDKMRTLILQLRIKSSFHFSHSFLANSKTIPIPKITSPGTIT